MHQCINYNILLRHLSATAVTKAKLITAMRHRDCDSKRTPVHHCREQQGPEMPAWHLIARCVIRHAQRAAYPAANIACHRRCHHSDVAPVAPSFLEPALTTTASHVSDVRMQALLSRCAAAAGTGARHLLCRGNTGSTRSCG